MAVIDSIKNTLESPMNSPQREALIKRTEQIFWSVNLAKIGIFLGFGLSSRLFSYYAPFCIFAPSLMLSDIGMIALNVQSMAREDSVWSPYYFATSFFKGTAFMGRWFSQKVQDHLIDRLA